MRVLVHAHTNYSRDGRNSPAELATLATTHGFGAVLVSDHYEHLSRESFNRLVADCRRITDCLLIPGYERSWRGYHLCAFGISTWIDGDSLGPWAEAVRTNGGLLCLAHPGRYGFEAPSEILDACDAVEIWNSKRPYDGALAPNPASAGLLRPDTLALAGQDFHRRLDLSSVAVVLEEEPSSSEAILAAIREGRFSIASRWLRFERLPPRRLWPLLRIWQRLRPPLWSGPIKVARALRRLARKLSRA